MKNKIVDILNINIDNVFQDRKIPKIKFYELDNFSREKEILFTNDINNIYILSIFNEDTVNIKQYITEDYNYSEVDFIYVDLKTDKNYKKIIEIIHSTIPNPIILILNIDDYINLSCANKRINKNDKNKQVFNETISSPFINIDSTNKSEKDFLLSINIKNCSFRDLYRFYNDFLNRIFMSKLINILGEYVFNDKIDIDNIVGLYNSYLYVESSIIKIEKDIQELSNFGDKVKLKIEKDKLDEKLLDIKSNLINTINK